MKQIVNPSRIFGIKIISIGILYGGVDSFDDDLVTDLNFLLVAMLRLSLDKEQILLSF